MYDPSQQVALLLAEDIALDLYGMITRRAVKWRHERD
jgi:hypothetical protein